jgi:hypothetical protein
MEEKKKRARAAVIREMMFLDFDGLGEHRGEILNDAANSVADSYDEYMEIWNYLQCVF